MKILKKKPASPAARELAWAVRGLEFAGPKDLLDLLSHRKFELQQNDLATIGILLGGRFKRPEGLQYLPDWLSQACASIARPFRPEVICDPCAGIGLLLGSIAYLLAPKKAIAVTKEAGEAELGNALLPILEWRVREPFEFLAERDGDLDLTVSFLPKSRSTQPPVDFENGKVDLSGLPRGSGLTLLVASALKLRETGIGMYFVPESLLFANNTLSQRLEPYGLFVSAAFRLPVGTFAPAVSTPTSLLVVSKRPREFAFVSELSEESERNDRVIENFHSNRDGGSFELGRLASPRDFKGFEFLQNREKLQDAISLYEKRHSWKLTKLGDFSLIQPQFKLNSPIRRGVDKKPLQIDDSLVSSGSVVNAADQTREPESEEQVQQNENFVFIPRQGVGRVVVSACEMELAPTDYLPVKIDPSQSLAIFVAKFLNSDMGRSIRRLVSGGSMPKLNQVSLHDLPILVPDLSTQHRILEIDRRISGEKATVLALQNELNELDREIWSNPDDLPAVERRLSGLSARMNSELKQRASESLTEWLETLPFPLASILRAWQAAPASDFRAKVEYLFHFFEATAHFLGLIFLSAYHSNPGLYQGHREKLSNILSNQHLSFSRLSFGTWMATIEYLGKQTRKLLDEEKRKSGGSVGRSGICGELFADESLELPTILSAKEVAKVLNGINQMRNDYKGHGGVLEVKAKELNEKMAGQLEQLRYLFADLWKKTELIACESVRPRRNRFQSDFRVFRGSNSTFLRDVRELSMSLDVGPLYLLRNEATRAMELLPLMRMNASPASEMNACYFFNRLEGGQVARMVSYHFASMPQITEHSPEVLEVVRELCADSL